MSVLVQLMPVNQVRQFAFHLGPALNFVLMISVRLQPASPASHPGFPGASLGGLASLCDGSWIDTLPFQRWITIGHFVASSQAPILLDEDI